MPARKSGVASNRTTGARPPIGIASGFCRVTSCVGGALSGVVRRGGVDGAQGAGEERRVGGSAGGWGAAAGGRRGERLEVVAGDDAQREALLVSRGVVRARAAALLPRTARAALLPRLVLVPPLLVEAV
jgi:hypothetical protein